jgi:hypothetical protein
MTKTSLSCLALTACALAAGLPAQAQHYAPGLEGIKAASIPPSGLYFRDYNYLYMADRYPGGPSDFDLTAYVQAPRVIYMTDWHPLGLDYGMDIIVPFAYTTVKTPAGRTCDFGLADISVEPLLLSKHFDRFDVSAGYSFWAPTGEFSQFKSGSPGKGYWGHMITLGGTWYPDSEKTYSISLLNRYEINQEQDQTHITPGNTDTLEFGIAKAFTKTIEAGVIGYYQAQTTDDTGAGSLNNHDHVAGIGPEINLFCTKLGVAASLRYAYEFEAKDRPQGHVLCLTLTKRF